MSSCKIIPDASNGKPSILFEKLLDWNNGNRNQAILEYDRILREKNDTTELDENGEPFIEAFSDYKTKAKPFSDKNNDNKFEALLNTRILDQRDIQNRIVRVRESLKNEKDPALRNELRITLQSFLTESEKIDKELTDIEKLSSLEDFKQYAEEDMKKLSSLFNKENLSYEDIFQARRLIKLYQRAGDFSPERPHLFFDQEELLEVNDGLKSIYEEFIDWKNKANFYEHKLVQIEEAKIENQIKQTFPNQQFDLEKIKKEVWGVSANTVDISEIDDVVFQAIHKWVKDANQQAKDEMHSIFNSQKTGKLDILLNKILPKLRTKDKSNPFSLFQQTFSNTDSRSTGNLVFRFTQEFFDKRKSLLRIAKTSKKPEDYRKLIEWSRKNEITFDVRKLFPDENLSEDKFSEADRKAHIVELKNHIGELAFDDYLERVKTKIDNFKLDKEAKRLELEQAHGQDQAIIEAELQKWDISYSPYWYAKFIDEGYKEKVNGQYSNPNSYYSQTIPRRFILENGERVTTPYYDSKFLKIESDPDLLEFYNYMLDTLGEVTSFLPYYKTKDMQINTLPNIRKNIVEEFSSKGMGMGLVSIWDSIKEATSIDKSSIEAGLIDQLGDGDVEKTVQTHFIMNNSKRIDDYIKKKSIEFELANKTKPTFKEKAEWRKDISNTLSKEKSMDLGKIMKAYSAMAISYKHKHRIENQVKLANTIVNRQLEGDGISGEVIKKGLKNKKDMLEYFTDVFYGITDKKREGVTDKKVLSSKEIEEKKELEKLMSDLEKNKDQMNASQFNSSKKEIETQLINLGNNRSWSGIGDLILKYIQIKGLGWNTFSGIANLGFGIISNIIDAGDTRIFNFKDLMYGYKLSLQSVIKNASFNTIETEGAKKIRSLMDKFDFLSEVRNEIDKTSYQAIPFLGGKLGFLAPYQATSRSEYLNQAPLMIAIMRSQTFKDKDGNSVRFYDAFNSDGSWKQEYGEEPTEKLLRLKSVIDKQIKINHGNYDPDSPLQIKKKFIGRALSQFRTWAFMGFSNRFRPEFTDHQLGIVRKGRYRTLRDIYRDRPDDMTPIDVTLFTLKQLARKTVGLNTKFEDRGFTEVDAANMRKNMIELYIYVGLMGISVLLKGINDDDEEDNLYNRMLFNFMYNQLNRLQTDILFYFNPVEFEKLQRNALPIFSLVTDFMSFNEAFYKYLDGEDILKTGRDKGKSRLAREAGDLLPFINQYYRLRRVSLETFE